MKIRRGVFAAALPALTLALAQTGGVPANGSYEGKPSVSLSNGALTLTVLLEGATVVDLVLAGEGEKISPFWNPSRMNRELGRPAPESPSTGHFVCVDGFGPASSEERAAGLPGHGEARVRTMAASSRREGNVAVLAMKATLPMVQESFTRTFRMADGENVVYVESRLESLLGFDRPISWAEHATVGSPFLESGKTVFDLSGSKSQTRPYQQAPNANAATVRRLASGADFTWPAAPGLDGKTVDMRVTPADPHYLDHTATLLDPSRDLQWATALNLEHRLLLGYVFRREDYPWLQTWGNYPPTHKMSRGMEFSTQPYDVPRREAVGMGTLFGQPTFRWLPAKATIETRFLFFFTPVPEGFARVDDVRLVEGRIVIEDRRAGRQVVVAASLPL